MGQEIVYCYHCQNRLLGSDFEKGLAFRVGAQVSCPDCVRGLFADLPPAQVDAEIARLKATAVGKRPGTSSRFPSVRPPTPDSTAKLKAITLAQEPPPRSKLPLALGAAVVAVVVVIVALVSSGSGRPPARPDEPAPSPSPSLVPVAKAGLPVGAFTEVDRLLAMRIESDDFSLAARELDTARSRRTESAWSAGIDERRARLEAKARDAMPRFIEPALAALREGRRDEVERLRGFIGTFPALNAEFERRLATVPPPSSPAPKPKPAPAPKPAPKPPPKPAFETATYRAYWDQAMALRDPVAARSAIEDAIKGLKSPTCREEAAQDLEILKLAAPVRPEALAALSRFPKDQKVRLDFRDDLSLVGSFEGTIASADPVRIRLVTESGTLDLPVSELSDDTIARLYVERPGHGATDARAAAAWCALRCGGDAAAPLDPALPAKYLEIAVKAPTADPDAADRREFWIGFSEAVMNRSRASGLDKLSRLPSPRFKAFVDLLMDGARDTFFTGADLAASGSFASTEREKIGTVWLSTADTPGHSFLEAEYYALPEQTYRAWALVGGCCLEVFSFSMQATGLHGIDPKTKLEASYEPGDAAGMAVKLPYLPLKKIHSQHLGPKEPDRWEWISLPLPKADAAGPRKIRVLTDQKGFSVQHLVVSATRRAPPSTAELKELLKERPAGPRFKVAPGPVAGKPTRTAYLGGPGGGDFEDNAPAGAVLVGLRYSPKGSRGNLKFVQAIFRLDEKTTSGGGHGGGDPSMPELVARPGYAIGQIVVHATDRIDGFKIVFMRHAGGRLLTGDLYESPWVGVPPKGETKTLGDGSPVGGIFGHAGSEIDGIGLILLK
ncbi:MAG TPA: hypothetical protein VE981_08670 [Planctomycetota bacterium]|nr:hypothetical protein [Planctomycetota bacterium]